MLRVLQVYNTASGLRRRHRDFTRMIQRRHLWKLRESLNYTVCTVKYGAVYLDNNASLSLGGLVTVSIKQESVPRKESSVR